MTESIWWATYPKEAESYKDFSGQVWSHRVVRLSIAKTRDISDEEPSHQARAHLDNGHEVLVTELMTLEDLRAWMETL